MSVDEAFRLLVQGTPIELLALFIISGYFGVWYWGRSYEALVHDRDDWKVIASASSVTVKEQADQIARLTDVVEKLVAATKRS